MNIIVTGGCGFIGSNLVERLLNEGNHVTVFDNLHTGNPKNLEGLDVKVFYEPYSKMDTLVNEPDVIFHLGIPSSTPMYKNNPKLVGEAINDAIDIFEFAKKSRCKVVYASSSSIYNGNRPPYREDLPVIVTDFYTECRYAIERLAKLYNNLYGVKSVGLRFFSVYGPKEKYKGNYANIISQFLWAMKKDEPPEIYGDGTQTRDFIYVGDVVEALILAMKKDFECEIFNVGTGISHTFNQIINLLNEMLGKNIKPVYKPNPIKNYVYDTLADTTKAEKILGFKAKTTLREGIKILIEKEK
ncbi:MAG: NAD-dependent epimerase/dehydratase family protein [Candidatus Bathyarchaeia archaeon]